MSEYLHYCNNLPNGDLLSNTDNWTQFSLVQGIKIQNLFFKNKLAKLSTLPVLEREIECQLIALVFIIFLRREIWRINFRAFTAKIFTDHSSVQAMVLCDKYRR